MTPELILGYPISTLPKDESIRQIRNWLETEGNEKVFVCANPHSLVIADADPEFRAAIHGADLVTPDGAGIVLASRLRRGQIRERVTGSDIFYGLSRAVDQGVAGRPCRYFFLGSTPETLGKIEKKLTADYPGIVFAGAYSPPFKEVFSEADSRKMVDAVNAAKPDVLWVGMTAPKQEKWIHQHRDVIFPPDLNDPAQHLFTENALEIIRQENGLKLIDSIPNKIHQDPPLFVIHGKPAFTIDAQHLLIAGQNACLATGGTLRDGNNARIIDVFIGQHTPQNHTVDIIADDTRHGNTTSQIHQIVDDIACSAQAQILALHVNYLHRRFRRNTFRPSPDVFIQHQITHHQDIGAGQTCHKFFNQCTIHDLSRRSSTAAAKRGMLIS